MRNGIAIALATGKNSQAVTMSFQKEYAERYDWAGERIFRLGIYLYHKFLILYGL